MLTFMALSSCPILILQIYFERGERISEKLRMKHYVLPRYVPGHQPVIFLVLIRKNMATLRLPLMIATDNIMIWQFNKPNITRK
jgi:hypothetical protein